MLTQSEKDSIVLAARERVGAIDTNGGGACLQLALAVGAELAKRGIRGVLQAGSAQWKCMEVDDGVSPTHFAYMWELSAQTQQRLAAGLMPEMHCWIGIPETQEVVDISTKYLVRQASLRAGITWTAEIPPDYIWCKGKQPPCDARYMVDPIATVVAFTLANRI